MKKWCEFFGEKIWISEEDIGKEKMISRINVKIMKMVMMKLEMNVRKGYEKMILEVWKEYEKKSVMLNGVQIRKSFKWSVMDRFS
jgi:hypothetical protein